ncbi:MAG: hypothetical protein ABJB73_07090 [Candidatus Nitrosocosmicus sp.]
MSAPSVTLTKLTVNVQLDVYAIAIGITVIATAANTIAIIEMKSICVLYAAILLLPYLLL